MINKRGIIWIMCISLIIVTAYFVQALSTSENKVYYSFDSGNRNSTNVFDLSGNNVDGFINGTLNGFVPGIINQAFNVYGVNNTIQIKNTGFFSNPTTGFTVNMWLYKTNDTVSNIDVFQSNGATPNGLGFYLVLRSDLTPGIITFGTDKNGVGGASANSPVLLNNTWYMVTGVYDPTATNNTILYINGQLNTTANITNSPISTALNFSIGNTQPDPARNLNMTLDELSIWNRSLSLTEIQELYNNGNGLNPYGAENFSIYARDNKDLSIILSSNATVDGVVYYSNSSTGLISTLIPSNSTTPINVTVNAVGFFSESYLNLIPNSTSNGILYSNLTSIVPRHTITAINSTNGLAINTFNITDDFGFFKQTTNGSLIYTGVWNTTTNATIRTDYFETKVQSFNNTVENDYQFSLRTTNTFNISVYDETLNQIITWDNITIEIIAPDVYYENITTQTGTASFDLIVPAFYRIKYVDVANQTYFERNYYTTLSQGQFQQINLYLLNKSYPNVFSSDGELLQVYDTTNNKIEGAIINVNKYFSQSNTYETVERDFTNFDGNYLAHLTNDGFYRYVIEYPEGTVVYSSSQTQVYQEPLNFFIPLISDASGIFFDKLGIQYSLTFDNSSKQIIYTYSDPNLISTNNCLYLYRQDSSGTLNLETTSCSESQSGTILATADGNYTYFGRAYATIEGDSYLIDEIAIVNGIPDLIGRNGWLAMWLFELIIVAIFSWNLFLMLLALPLPLLAFSAMNFIPFGIFYAIPVAISIWVIAFIVAKRS